MRELLPDNLVLAERMETLPARVAPAKTPEQREVGSLLTWVSSFATYIAVVAQAHPDRVADMLAYMRLIIREARKYGGNGWLTYDMVFWCNHERKSDPWNYIDPSLHTAYIGGQGLPPLTPCRYRNEVDHRSEDCAIAPTLSPQKLPPSGNRTDISHSEVQSVLLCRLRVPQVCRRKGSASHGTKGDVYSRGRAHTSTSAHRAKPVTRQKTARLPLQTQPSSSWPNRLSRAIPAVAFMTALASVHGTCSHIPSQHVCAYGWLIITTFFCFCMHDKR